MIPQVYILLGKDCLEAVGRIVHSTIVMNQNSNQHTMIQSKTSTISSIVIGLLNIYKEATKNMTKNRK